ncbi:MAG: alpha-amylase family glycosyl hydrolase [Desulfuromonadales bacterium]
MSERHVSTESYFLYDLQLNAAFWRNNAVAGRLRSSPPPPLNYSLNAIAEGLSPQLDTPIETGNLALLSALNAVFRHISWSYLAGREVKVEGDHLVIGKRRQRIDGLFDSLKAFVVHFPPAAVVTGETDAEHFFSGGKATDRQTEALVQMFALAVQSRNPALEEERRLIDDEAFQKQSGYRLILERIDRLFGAETSPSPFNQSLSELLSQPLRHSPDDLVGQVAYVRSHWGPLLPEGVLNQVLTSFDLWQEEQQIRGAGPGGPAPVPDYTEVRGTEIRRYSPDADWMPNVVLMAKSIQVWLDQLSRKYQLHLRRLDDIPDAELDLLNQWNITGLWLIGIWERSRASQRIKQMRGNPEAEASAYSLYDYVIAEELGGEAALDNLRERCSRRGIRLACDMVPNHTGICSRWIVEHPDWYIQTDIPPYPGYHYTGPDLCEKDEVSVFIEDGYWDHTEAAVTFKHVDHRTAKERFIYHGNDGTHLPWNDTAQLNFLLPDVRQAVLEEIVDIARSFSIIRFDAAMTLAKKHFQRLWYPQPGGGAGVPSRADFWMSRQDFERAFPVEFWREVVDRIAAEVPDTLLLAEAFWLMEGFFVRTVGMHRVYNSAFMNMLKTEDNARYRNLLKNTLEFDPEILKRFVNFMSNPDEETAVEQFGTGDKYFGVAILLVTLPGLPMFAHGQVEGLREKYGMEYPRAYWDESVDEPLLLHHERMLFPLLGRRPLFSEVENFALFDFYTAEGVNEDVISFSNRLDDQRALVVYHNRYGETSGWIRTAWSPGTDQKSGMENATLASALALGSDETIWRFKDHCSGKSYLRKGRQFNEDEFFLQLGPYEACVFIDFEPLEDPEGEWRTLWRELDGQPATDLDRQRQKLRYSNLHAALVDTLVAMGTPESLTVRQLAPLVEELEMQTGREIDLKALLSALQRDLERLPAEEPRYPMAIAPPLVLLRHLDIGFDLVSDRFDRLLLEAPLFEWLAERDLPVSTAEVERLVGLVRSLLLWQQWLQQKTPDAALRSLLEEPQTRTLIGCNRFKDNVWFNQESMELLLNGMEMAAEIFYPPAGAVPLVSKIDQYRTACHQSGYSLGKFLRLF